VRTGGFCVGLKGSGIKTGSCTVCPRFSRACNLADDNQVLFGRLLHRCRSRLVCGGAKEFCPNFSILARNVFVRLFSTLSLTKIMKTFFGVTSKKDLHVFFFGFEENKSSVGRHFCLHFQGFCPDFRQIKTFGGALALPPLTPLICWNCFEECLL